MMPGSYTRTVWHKNNFGTLSSCKEKVFGNRR